MVMNITFTAAISGIIGAKLFHNLENWDELMANPIEALLSFSGLTMYGGLIFGTVAVIYMTKNTESHPYTLPMLLLQELCWLTAQDV